MKFNLKNFLISLFAGVIGVALFFWIAQPSFTGFVQFPDDITQGINSLVLLAVSWVIGQVIVLIPFFAFLDEFRVPLSSAIALALIQWGQTMTPDFYGPVVVQVLRLILLVLGLYLTFAKLKEKGIRAFQ